MWTSTDNVPKNTPVKPPIKNKNKNGKSRYDFQYEDKEGYKITIEGLSRSFDKEFCSELWHWFLAVRCYRQHYRWDDNEADEK